MVHGYRTLQHWNQWLNQHFLGNALLDLEKNVLAKLLDKHYGKQALLIGVPHQYPLMEATKLPCHNLLSSFLTHERQPRFIEGNLHELPILTGSIDLVILPHTLEYVENPRRLIHEAARVVKPEGLIAVFGFNPYSLWGLQRTFSRQKEVPWTSQFINAHQIKNWLKLAEFQVEKHQAMMFRPAISHEGTFKRLEFLESIGNVLHFVGGIYCVIARAKVIPMTPIRMKWKQKLDSIRITATIPGNIASHTEHKK